MSWTAPSNGGSPITSYTVTPYTTGESSAPLTPVTVTGAPAATTATVTGLTNGTAYLFTVSRHQRHRDRTRLHRTRTQVIPAGPPLAPTGGDRDGGHGVGHRELDRAGFPRQPHHVLHRHARTSVRRHRSR